MPRSDVAWCQNDPGGVRLHRSGDGRGQGARPRCGHSLPVDGGHRQGEQGCRDRELPLSQRRALADETRQVISRR